MFRADSGTPDSSLPVMFRADSDTPDSSLPAMFRNDADTPDFVPPARSNHGLGARAYFQKRKPRQRHPPLYLEADEILESAGARALEKSWGEVGTS